MAIGDMLGGERGRGSVMLGRVLVVVRSRSRRYTQEGWMDRGLPLRCSMPYSITSSRPPASQSLGWGRWRGNLDIM